MQRSISGNLVGASFRVCFKYSAFRWLWKVNCKCASRLQLWLLFLSRLIKVVGEMWRHGDRWLCRLLITQQVIIYPEVKVICTKNCGDFADFMGGTKVRLNAEFWPNYLAAWTLKAFQAKWEDFMCDSVFCGPSVKCSQDLGCCEFYSWISSRPCG